MTRDELDERHRRANWVIARRSASAAGKSLMFTQERLHEALREIGAIYGLSDDEQRSLAPAEESGALSGVHTVAGRLLTQGVKVNATHALDIAATAIKGGRKMASVAALVKAGPGAARLVAGGGKVASKGTPWGWIATVGLAVGTAGVFAYRMRGFSLAAHELVRVREGIAPLAAAPEGVAAVPADARSAAPKAVPSGVFIDRTRAALDEVIDRVRLAKR